MQIKDLPASSVLNADDVLAKDTNGIATEKITGANLAAAVKLLASLLGVSDVVNSLISTSTTAPLAAAQGKALNEHIGVVQNGLSTIEINGNSTTHAGGAAQGDFVIVRNSTISGITDGLYIATQTIPANTVITSAYLTAADGGGLNVLNSYLAKASDAINGANNVGTYYFEKYGNVVWLHANNKYTSAVAAGSNLVSIPAKYRQSLSNIIYPAAIIRSNNTIFSRVFLDTDTIRLADELQANDFLQLSINWII